MPNLVDLCVIQDPSQYRIGQIHVQFDGMGEFHGNAFVAFSRPIQNPKGKRNTPRISILSKWAEALPEGKYTVILIKEDVIHVSNGFEEKNNSIQTQ